MAAWSVYLARCADDTLYCGVAPDVAARIAAHDAGRGARYTRGRGPLTLLATRRCRDRGAALRLEHAVKQLSRPAKLALAADPRRLAALARRIQRKRARAAGVGSARGGPRAGARGDRGARPSATADGVHR